MTKFLTSVRDLEEAQVALANGSDWLDLKEPVAGALGAVSPRSVSAVVAWLKQHHPTIPCSTTIGDYWRRPEAMPERVRKYSGLGVDYVKVGIFADDLSSSLLEIIVQCISIHPRLIVLLFAESPPTARAIENLLSVGVAGLMLDTADKGLGGLLDRMDRSEINRFVHRVVSRDRLCGLAGSLSLDDIPKLIGAGADYLGFRGALCEGSARNSAISGTCVAQLKQHIVATRQELIDGIGRNNQRKRAEV